MPEIAVDAVVALEISRFYSEQQPDLVECTLKDAFGENHVIIEKVPIVTAEELGAESNYPCLGCVACEIDAEWTDVLGRSLIRINTTPWGVESVKGASQFVVEVKQVKRFGPGGSHFNLDLASAFGRAS